MVRLQMNMRDYFLNVCYIYKKMICIVPYIVLL